MVVPEAARPPAESLDSPYAPSKSIKGKSTSVSSIASMKLLMRGVSPKDIFSRAPSRAPSEIGLARTSGAQGSGSSALETIDQGASESDAETAAPHVARLTKSEEERAKSIEVLLAKRDAGEAPSADEPSSAELRKELVGLEAKRAAASASVGAAVARLTRSEEERAKSIEVLLAKRDAGEAPSADEPSSAELRKELVGLEAKRAAASASVGGAVARLTKSEEERAKSIEVLLAKRDAGEAPSADEPSSAELRKELVGLEAKRAAASASVGGAVARLTRSEEERAKSIEVLLAKRDAGEAPSADEPSSAELRKELVGLEAKRAAASASVGGAVARLTKSEEERAKSIEVLLAKRDAGEAPSADEPSSAELRKELVGLEAKRAAASASVGGAVARLTRSEEERAKSIEVLLAKRDAGEAPSADEPSSAELRKELVGLEAKRAAASASVSASGAAAGASTAAPGSVRAASPAPSAVSEAVSGAPSVASVELDLPRAASRAGGGAPRRASAAIAASPYGSALRSKSKMRRAVGQVAAASAATRAMKPGKKKGAGVSAEAPVAPGHARTDSAVVRALVGDAIATIAEDAFEPESTVAGDASGRSSASAPVAPGHARTDSAVVRGLVGDAIAKVSAVSDESGFQIKAPDGSPPARRSRGDGAETSAPTRAAPAPASSAKSRFRRAVSAVSMGSLFARAGPRRDATPPGSTDPHGGAADAAEDPVMRLVQGALRAATEEEAGAEASSLGAYGALTEEEEARKKAILDALARLDAAAANGDGDGDGSDASDGKEQASTSASEAFSSSRLHELQTELIRLETKRVKAAAGGASNATLSTALALTPQEEDRAAFLERLLAKRESEGVPPSARPSADARRELIALLARRAAAEQAEDERASVLEAMLEAEDAKDANAEDANAKDANVAAAAASARDELRALRERRAARRFDLVVTSPAVPPRGTNIGEHRHQGRNHQGIEEESESEKAKGAAFLATPKPPARRARDAVPSDASGRRPSGSVPKRPGSTQRSQFGPMVDSLKRSSPRVGFGSALRFDFQRASAPPPDSERGRTLRRSQSRLRAARGGAPAGLAAADDAFGASFSVPGPGTYATTKYRAFGPQSDGEKKSFPAVSMGRAGRFAAAERETKTTRSWPGPDAYDAASSIGAQRVSRCDTLPRIAFTRARRAVGNVEGDGVSESDEGDAIPDYAIRGGVSGRRPESGFRFPGAGRWRSARDGGGGDGATFAPYSSRLYDSVGDQALSYHPNAPYAHFGSAFRERAGLASLSKKQAKKAMCGKLGPGPAYPAGPAAVGKQVHSGKTNAPAVGFTRRARLADAHSEDAAEEPGPGSYRV